MDPDARALLAAAAARFWQVEALLACGDPEGAKRLVAARFWAATRHPDAGRRQVRGPAPGRTPAPAQEA